MRFDHFNPPAAPDQGQAVDGRHDGSAQAYCHMAEHVATGQQRSGHLPMTLAETALYQAEQALPGTAVKLAIAAGEMLALSSHCALHLNDDPDEAVSIAPGPASRLYARLRQTKYGVDAAPLQVKLPPDVAIIVLRPAALTIRQDGVKRIAFHHQIESTPL